MNEAFNELKTKYSLARSKQDRAQLELVAGEFRALNMPLADAYAVMISAAVHRLNGKYTEALADFDDARQRMKECGDLEYEAGVTGEIGLVYWQLGDYGTALEFLMRALEMQQTHAFTPGVAASLSNIGLIYADTGDYARALEYYLKALSLHKQVGNRFNQANTTGNIGLVYGDVGDYSFALDYCKQALALHIELGNLPGAANTMGNIGHIYMMQAEYEESEKWLRQAIESAQQHDLPRELTIHTHSLAAMLTNSGRYDEAMKILDEYRDLFESYPTIKSASLETRATVLMGRSDYTGARVLVVQALEQATRRNDRSAMSVLNKMLRDIAKQLADFEGYIHHNELYQTIRDEISGTDSSRRFAMQDKERVLESERAARQQERAVLYSTLPQHIADRVIGGEVVNDHIDEASVLFVDIVGFTTLSSSLTSQQVTSLLDAVFAACDSACVCNKVTRVKTIGDSYLAFVSG